VRVRELPSLRALPSPCHAAPLAALPPPSPFGFLLTTPRVLPCVCSRHRVLRSDDASFWATTGGFPQEIVVQLRDTTTVSRIRITATNVHQIAIERCEGRVPMSWEKVLDAALPDVDGRLHTESFTVSPPAAAAYIKLKLLSGWVSPRRVRLAGIHA
jgi:hypothetical protein